MLRQLGCLRAATVLALAAFVGFVSFAGSVALAAPSREVQTKIKTVEASIRKAGQLYVAKKYKDAGVAIKEAQDLLDQVWAADKSPETIEMTAGAMQQLVKAHGLLELEGVKLTPLKPAPTAPAATAPGAKPAPGAPAPAANGKVSFAKDVAPIFLRKCGNCHVMGMRGDISLATYNALMKGHPKDGVIVMPGNATGSRIIEVIESGDMPKGGGKITALELAALSKWITEGAVFDGPSPAANLNEFARVGRTAKTVVQTASATGKEKVLFARDIAPVLIEKCSGCHGDRQPKGEFSVLTYKSMIAGGESGALLVPGKPAESLLIQKLRGKEGARMPPKKGPLPDNVIALFETWISEGATFDGPNPASPLEEVVLLMKAIRASHEELTDMRTEFTAKQWRLVIPDATPNQHRTKNFLLYGNVSQEALEEIGKVAEAQVPTLEKIFSATADQPFIKGCMTLFVFDKRFDYGEIGQMIEKREIPTDWKGHWRFTIIDAYGCILPAKSGEYPLSSLVAQQLAGTYVASLGNNKAPHWFAEGTARAVAAKIDPKDPRVKQWDERASSVLAGSKPDAFLKGELGPEETDVVSYEFVKALMSNSKGFQSVLSALRAGKPFDMAFSSAFGGKPEQLASAAGGGSSSKAPAKRGK